MKKDEQTLANQIKILNLQNWYNIYKDLKLVPIELDKIFKLASTILVTIIITVVKLFLFKQNL